jgi:predicted enzyme related to lactoylglutathione lyase
MAAKLYRVILPVNDIMSAKIFYETLLAVAGELVSPGRCYFDCDGTILACYDPVADGDALDDGWRFHPNQYIYFSVNNLEATRVAAGTAGATEIGPVARMPWGETLFYAKDPFGSPICFVAEGSEFKGTNK